MICVKISTNYLVSGLSYDCEIDDFAPVNQADLQCRLYNSTQYEQ